MFEERVSGNVPDGLFKKMLSDYQQEIETLNQKASELREQDQDSHNNRLDRATVYQLVNQVSVHEQSDECGIRTQTVQIKYNFVGKININ